VHKFLDSEEYKRFEQNIVKQQATKVFSAIFNAAGLSVEDVNFDMILQGYFDAMKYSLDFVYDKEEDLIKNVRYALNNFKTGQMIADIVEKKFSDFLTENKDKILKE
jgi:hypothetical protein